MQKKIFDFEKSPASIQDPPAPSDNFEINEKYERGYSRVVTETGSYKIGLIREIFSQPNYELHPDYQRRITWNSKKRSKLIESLIINIPIPPIFLYEYDFDKYEVMDGLQRITAIKDFYNNVYPLVGLEEWPELNGKRYKDLPEKIKEGIDRRQIQVTSLLKESASSAARADKIKRLVFERLNTGGVKLQGQEIRNAVLSGKGNDLCIELSNNCTFRNLWKIPSISVEESDIEDLDSQDLETVEDDKLRHRLERNVLYKRMYDVELILRFFAMRFVDDFNCPLAMFLDNTLITLNQYSSDQLITLKGLFISAIEKADTLFGERAFSYFYSNKWSSPAKMIYDPLMQVLLQEDIQVFEGSVNENCNALKNFYIENSAGPTPLFDGKNQAKEDIQRRMEKLDLFVRTLSK